MTTIQIKAVKIHLDMSEETTCFSASLYVGGKRTANVMNHGHGGSNIYHPSNDAARHRLKVAQDEANEAAGWKSEALDGFVEYLVLRADPQMVRFAKMATSRGARVLIDEGEGRWSAVPGAYDGPGTVHPLDYFTTSPSCTIDRATAEVADLILV